MVCCRSRAASQQEVAALEQQSAKLEPSERDALKEHNKDKAAAVNYKISQLDRSLSPFIYMNVSCRSVATSQQEVAALEQRLVKAEQSEGEALRELREAEATAVEHEGLLLRAAALEGKLKELQAEQGQLDTYKQVRVCLYVSTCTTVARPDSLCSYSSCTADSEYSKCYGFS